MKLTPSPDGDGKGKHVWVVGNLELCTHSPMHLGVLEALLLLQTVSHAEPKGWEPVGLGQDGASVGFL